MKKLVALILCFVMIFALCACGTPAAKTEPASPIAPNEAPKEAPKDAIVFTMGSTGAVEDISTKSAQKFCDLVAERSDGAITINLNPASQLGSAVDQMDMLSTGAIDLFLEANLMSIYGINDLKPASIMFATRNHEDFVRLLESDYYADCIEQFRKASGITVLAKNWYRNATAIASSTKLETLEDCKGVKLRVPNVASTVDMFNGLGFNATPVAYNETLISFQQKVISAVWCTEDAIWTMGFYEPAKYVFELNASADNMFVYMNDALFNGLPAEQQDLLIQCAKDAGDYYTSLAEDALKTNRANWEAKGVETITISPEEAERWAAVTFEFAKKQEAAGEWREGLFAEVLAINGYTA